MNLRNFIASLLISVTLGTAYAQAQSSQPALSPGQGRDGQLHEGSNLLPNNFRVLQGEFRDTHNDTLGLNKRKREK